MVSLIDACRAIGVSRLKEQKPGVSWAGLYGLGGETQTYGFEPEVRDPLPTITSE